MCGAMFGCRYNKYCILTVGIENLHECETFSHQTFMIIYIHMTFFYTLGRISIHALIDDFL